VAKNGEQGPAAGSGAGNDSYEALQAAGEKSGGFMNRWNQALQDAIHSGRAENRTSNARQEGRDNPNVTADDLALRRARYVKSAQMIIPEGVIIQGSLTSGSQSEIFGRVEGDVNVEGDLLLGGSALISGNVRTRRCKVEGMVEGKVECAETLELGQGGRLNSDVMAGKVFTVAGQVFGSVTCAGLLKLTATAQVTGDVRCRRLLIEEGATLNGACAMRAPAERPEEPAQKDANAPAK